MSGSESQSPKARTITVRGTARTGAAGALILVPDELPVYLGGLRRCHYQHRAQQPDLGAEHGHDADLDHDRRQ